MGKCFIMINHYQQWSTQVHRPVFLPNWRRSMLLQTVYLYLMRWTITRIQIYWHEHSFLHPCPCSSLSRFVPTVLLEERAHTFQLQMDRPKLCQSMAPRALPMTLQSKPSIFFWNSLWKLLPDDHIDQQDLWTWLKLDFCNLRLAN